MLVDAPIQTPVPATATSYTPTHTATSPWNNRVAELSTGQRAVSRTPTNSAAVRPIMASQSTHRQNQALMSPPAGVLDNRTLDNEPPVLAPVLSPKPRDQQQYVRPHSSDSETAADRGAFDDDDDDDDDEDIYKHPRQDFYSPPTTNCYSPPIANCQPGDDETYDTPTRLKQRDDIYDLPPRSSGNKAEDRNSGEVYDILPVSPPNATNLRSPTPPPPDHGVASHHSYVNAPVSVTVSEDTEQEQESDSAVACQVTISPRTRSFKQSSDSRYVLHLSVQDIEKLIRPKLSCCSLKLVQWCRCTYMQLSVKVMYAYKLLKLCTLSRLLYV